MKGKEEKTDPEWIKNDCVILERVWIPLQASVSLSDLSWSHVIYWLCKHCLETSHGMRTKPRCQSVQDFHYGVCWCRITCITYTYIIIYRCSAWLLVCFGLSISLCISKNLGTWSDERFSEGKAPQILIDFQWRMSVLHFLVTKKLSAMFTAVWSVQCAPRIGYLEYNNSKTLQ